MWEALNPAEQHRHCDARIESSLGEAVLPKNGGFRPQAQYEAAAALQTKFAQGVALHQQGKLAEAERIYAEILRQQPNHFDALHLLGVIAAQTLRTERAVELIKKAIGLNATVAGAHSNLGNALRDLKRPEDALASYDKAIALKPDYAEAHNNRGLALQDLNRPENALASYDKAIALKPNYAEAHNNRGNALVDLTRPAEALASYDKAIALKPDYAEAYYNRGNALVDLKHPAEAFASYDKAIALKPDFAEAYYNRALALQNLNRAEDALASYDKAIALEPNYAEAYSNRGNALLDLKRPTEALASCDKAIASKPDFAEAYYNRGNALTDLKRRTDALVSYDKAIALKPDFAEAHNNRALALQNLNRPEDALASYDKAIALKPDYAEAHSNRGLALQNLNRPEDALASYDKAIALKPDYAEAHSNRGNALTQKGDFTAAIESYNRALHIKPDYAECYRHYSIVTKFKQDNPNILKMKKLICTEDLSEKDLMHLSFALAKSEDDLGNDELFINYLSQGNAIRKKVLAYDIAQDKQLFASIKQFFDSGAANEQADFVPNCSTTPIFILGMPRSGTTLVEQIVSSHSNVYGGGELDFLNQAIINSRWHLEKGRKQVFSSVRSFYNLKLSEVSAASIITDKMPLNFRWIGFILNALPDAKIVHVKRNPAAVCWSNLKTYFVSEGMGFTFDRQDIAKYYRLYKDLMDFWQRKYPDKIYNLNYERLTENQEEETRKLLDYLELEWEDNVLEFYKNKRSVNTASTLQIRQKMFKGSSLEWKKYEQWLQPMLEILNA